MISLLQDTLCLANDPHRPDCELFGRGKDLCEMNNVYGDPAYAQNRKLNWRRSRTDWLDRLHRGTRQATAWSKCQNA
ncbi:MAG: hypothetical protein QGI86_23440 [Candidatus Poribacteria bacterium]|nr:hypothetical protein [Candidatus Poribacteria bacterium]MDP6749524.1 hypothetical protein [Candidatus Poribacteria bacterium]MDP6994879.1 hypothetical protein [Candidatus Poribacteria bacterium]